MHSVVVLGDTRIHSLHGNKDFPIDEKINGGALMMKAAIVAARENLKSSSPFKVLSYEGGSEYCDTILGQELFRWELEKRSVEGIPNSNFRLFEQAAFGQVALPLPEFGLLRSISSGNFRQDIESEKPIPPDVVVLDDLGLQLADVRFPALEANEVADKINLEYPSLHDEKPQRPNESQQLKAEFQKSQSVEDFQKAFQKLRKYRVRQLELTLQTLFARLTDAANQLQVTGQRYPVEPVIIISANGVLPTCSQAEVNHGEVGNVWEHLISNVALRRRTIVLLDAKDLRDRISISSGLSWERTAQDAIVEFKQDPQLRPLMKFGHIVIRFGLTGVLLISNDGNQDHTYTLYFNPDHDDAIWTHDSDGRVLGETAVLASTIVEYLTERCSWRSGAAILHDLQHAVDHALPAAIQRLLTHFEAGYGDRPKAFDEQFQSHHGFHQRTFAANGAVLRTFYDEQLTHVSVQRMKLSPFRSRRWSILLQSSQANLNNVAREIVKYGPKVVLNTLHEPVSKFVEYLVDELEAKQKDKKPNFTLFRPNDIPPDDKGRTRSLDELIIDHCKMIDQPAGAPADTLRRWFGAAMHTGIANVADRMKAPIDAEDFVDGASSLLRELDQLERLFKGGGSNPKKDEVRKAISRIRSRSRSQVGVSEQFRAKVILRLREEVNQFQAECEEFRCEIEKLGQIVRSLRGRGLLEKAVVNQIGKLEGLLGIGNDPAAVCNDPGVEIRRCYAALRLSILRVDYKHAGDLRQQVIRALENIETKDLASPRRRLRLVAENFLWRTVGDYLRPPISTPILRLGKGPSPEKPDDIDKRLIVIDRKEVESIRAVKRMIELYMEEESPERPLSIAVFGPPGSGKSVAVTKIIDMIEHKTSIKLEKLTINLAQLPGVEQLNDQFDEIAKLKDKTPIVFFDEFDSPLGDKDFGWLKFFLAAMEDGKHYGNDVKKAVFVFAGGTSETFEEFSLADRSSTDPQMVDFSKAKGPDFVSRLRGHINVVGINPSGQDDDLYLIRRALALRFQLGIKQRLGDTKEAEIDDNLLNALLHVPEYRHGARSLRMVLDLCTHKSGKRISMSEVPPIHQLNMHVDGKSFATLASGQTKPTVDQESNQSAG